MLILALPSATIISQPLDDNERPFVFIVEDDPGDEQLTVRSLKGLAKKTEVAKNGSTALQRLTQLCEAGRPPDVVLLDLKMPLLNGFEVLKAMKEHPLMKEISVVIFSSSDLESDRDQSIELGARQFVTKPVDYQKYIDAIRKAVHYALLRLS